MNDKTKSPTIALDPAKIVAKHRSTRYRATRALMLGLLSRMRHGAFIIELDGKRKLYGRPVPGERVPELRVNSPLLWRSVVGGGSAGLGRAYFLNYWGCEDLDDLTMFLRIATRNLDAIERASAFGRRFKRKRPRNHTPRNERPGQRDVDRDNVRAHYDLGNELFASFLDETMTYSCAIFASHETSLRDAQTEKLDRICRKLELTPSHHVLEIGTGWGSFAIHAASTYGCRVTTTTISARQYELAKERVKAAGVSDLVTVLESDYRDLTGSFDRVVSIEMIEALDWRQYETFFTKCSELLEPDGIIGLQAITIGDERYEQAKRAVDFVKAYVFPGSCIPSVSALVAAAAHTEDLRLISLDDIGQHYVETLRRWRVSFQGIETKLDDLGLDETFARLFEFYLCYCEAGFAERRIGDVQCFFAKKGWRPTGLRPPRV